MVPPRHVLVTGAARGIGAATALRFHKAGHRVTGLVRSLDTLEIDTDGMEIVVGDLGEMDRSAFVAEHGPFDVLVNNAGHYPPTLLETLNLEDYRQILEVNLVAAVDLISLASEFMKQQQWGRIVNVGSITTSVAWSGWVDRVAYASSKGGLEVATRVAARALGPHSITVNTISPGAIPTAAEPAESENHLILSMQALPFRGSVQDIASAIAFLASEDAKFITGQNINVDGGWVMQ